VPDHLLEQHAIADLEVIGISLRFRHGAGTGRGDSPARASLALSGMMMQPLVFSSASITCDHDAVMQRHKFRFSHDGSSWRLGFR